MPLSDIAVIVVAAGRGSRMEVLTADKPKSLLPFKGAPLIEWQLAALAKNDLTDVTVVTGYRAEKLEGYGARRIHNAAWETTNMVYSLFCARDILLSGKTVIVVYADIIYQPNLLAAILTKNADIATVIDLEWHALWTARFEDPLEDAETLRLSADGHLVEIGQVPSSLEEIEGQYIGLTKFSAAGALAFEAVYRDISKYVPGKTMHNCYFTDVLQGLVERGDVIDTVSVRGGWLEFDSPSDRALYEKVSGQDSEHKFFDIGWR